MPVLPKSVLVFGASLQTARTARQIRRKDNGAAAQSLALNQLLARQAATDFGHDHGLEPGLRYETFRQRVPLQTYDALLPYLDRMRAGESDVLSPGHGTAFATTAGTILGTPKAIPLNAEMIAHFRDTALRALFCYTARARDTRVLDGRQLLLGASTALIPIASAPFDAHEGPLAGILARHLRPWASHHFLAPEIAVSDLPHGPEKIAALAADAFPRDIRLLAASPNWLLELAPALLREHARDGHAASDLASIWPHLQVVVHGGSPLTPFRDEVRRFVGRSVEFHEIYACAEGFIAAQDEAEDEGLHLFTDAGLFFEFIPLADFLSTSLEHAGSKAVPLEHVAVGRDYVIVLTTPAGLTRYVLDDVVRFTSTQPPRLVHVGRTPFTLNSLGEMVNERDLTEALATVCQRHNWSVSHFHVAPLSTSSLTGQSRGRHEWWLELKPGTMETPRGPAIAPELDAELRPRCAAYDTRRRSGGIEAPLVRLVMPGVFESWMKRQLDWSPLRKLPRSRPDRSIADELAAIARFCPE